MSQARGGVEPHVGALYSVACPSCHSDVGFECQSTSIYGVKCDMCEAVIDLRNPQATLPVTDSGMYPVGSGMVVHYSPAVENGYGEAAETQVQSLLQRVKAEQMAQMPVTMSGETVQAFSSRRNQQLAEKFYFLFPLTYAVEWVVFGTKPTAKVGHIRIFRKWIPLYGYVNIPVPKTSTSYAAPSIFTFVLHNSFSWFCHALNEDWLVRLVPYETILVVGFYLLMAKLVYTDPGYVKPAYIDGDSSTGLMRGDELSLREIENKSRESIFETVNGMTLERKWCSTCEMHRPLRAAHCYNCGVCVYNHDHHCSVIGTCVGLRTVELFAFFVLLTATAIIYPLTCVIIAFIGHSKQMTSLLFYGGIALAFALFVFGLAIGSTAVGMWWAVLSESTTRERMQNAFQGKSNPFSRGILGNVWFHLVTRKQTPSILTDAFVSACAAHMDKKELGTGVDVVCL